MFPGGYKKLTGVSVDPGSIATVSTGKIAVTIKGVDVDDHVVAIRPDDLNDDLIYGGCRVTAKDTLTLYIYNPTAAAIDDTAKLWNFIVFRGETAPFPVST